MSKRFGRNQKRKMRQRIERLEGELRASRISGATNARIVDETACVLGKHFITLGEPKNVTLSHLQDLAMRTWRVPHIDCDPDFAVSVMDQPHAAMQEFMIKTLPILQCEKVIASELQQKTLFAFTYGDREVAVGVDENTLMMMDRGSRVLFIADRVAAYLDNELRKGVKRY